MFIFTNKVTLQNHIHHINTKLMQIKYVINVTLYVIEKPYVRTFRSKYLFLLGNNRTEENNKRVL